MEKWRGLLKNAMESAEAKWLGDVPAIADVKCRRDLAGNAIKDTLKTNLNDEGRFFFFFIGHPPFTYIGRRQNDPSGLS